MMAYHVQCTVKTAITSGLLAGVLALAAAVVYVPVTVFTADQQYKTLQVKHILQVWKKGSTCSLESS